MLKSRLLLGGLALITCAMLAISYSIESRQDLRFLMDYSPLSIRRVSGDGKETIVDGQDVQIFYLTTNPDTIESKMLKELTIKNGWKLNNRSSREISWRHLDNGSEGVFLYKYDILNDSPAGTKCTVIHALPTWLERVVPQL